MTSRWSPPLGERRCRGEVQARRFVARGGEAVERLDRWLLQRVGVGELGELRVAGGQPGAIEHEFNDGAVFWSAHVSNLVLSGHAVAATGSLTSGGTRECQSVTR